MPRRHPSLLAAPAPARGRLWLTRARLFDGTASGVRDGAAVLVSDGVIERVGDARDAVPEAARVIDLQGRMLLPGPIDLHVHTQVPEIHRMHGAEPILAGMAAHFLQAGLRETLAAGVTTVRNVGGQGSEPQVARQAMRYGAFRGPRLLTCGQIISATAPGGRFYGEMYREADGPWGVRKAVREQLRDGADFIKVMTTGARSNEMEDPGPAQFTGAEFAALADEARRLLDQMAAHGQVLVPTLSGYYWMGGMPTAIDPSTATIDADLLPLLVELAHYNLEQGTLSMRAAANAGVRIGLGSDAEGLSGEATALELVRMVHHGLSPADALRAATSVAAEAIGLQEHIGTVQAGKLADLLVIDGDALAAPGLLLDPARSWLVLQLGHIVAGAMNGA